MVYYLHTKRFAQQGGMGMACVYHVEGGILPQAELDAYLARARERFGREPEGMSIRMDGEYVDINYDFSAVPFQRIRRITGYLVGTLDRFNNGKRAEEHDRVKHGFRQGQGA
jgi:hypothetical protein